MKKKKEFEIKAINHALYDARIKKHLSLKDAAVGLKIKRLHLSLIEKGYLHVSKKLESRFITFYKLDKDFFSKNTTYVEPINIKYDDPKVEEKLTKEMHKKRSKIISGVLALLMLGLVGMGIYYFTRTSTNPRAAWSKDFTTFRENVLKDPRAKQRICLEYPDDIEYYIEESDSEGTYTFSIPSKEKNADGLYMSYYGETVSTRDEITLFAYNNKKVLIFEGEDSNAEYFAVATYQTIYKFSMKKVSVVDENGSHDYFPGSDKYSDYESKFSVLYSNFIVKIHPVIQNDFPLGYTVLSLMDDMQKISTYKVTGFRLGMRLIFIPSIVFILASASFVVTMVKDRKRKPKVSKAKAYVVHESKYTADAALVYRSVPNDTKFPTIIPEFVLRALALLVLLLSSIGTVWVTQSLFTGQTIKESLEFNDIISNIFVAGTTLAFFLKLEVYQKKTYKELVKNILTLFVIGLVFYVSECVIYACLSSGGAIYNELVKLLAYFIPGNIVWNLMLYSLIFLFLFTLPEKFKDQPHKVLIWRLCSAIPTLLMLAAFIFQGTFKGSVPQYVSFIFYTNGALMTGFAIFYLYSLFFLQQYVRLKYGEDFAKVYVDSRRYAVGKNVLASIIIIFFVGIDLLFRFYLPDNGLKLGNNWAIALLIPFILFYHPHIGKRTPKWDLAYIIMYAVFLVGGFIIALGMFTNSLDLSELSEILK